MAEFSIIDISTIMVTRAFYILPLIALTILFFIFDKVFGIQKYAEEPPYITSSIPYFGHTIGLLRHKMQYYVGFARLPIFSLAIPGGRLYVVNHPNLVMAVQRMPKALSFWPVVANTIVQLGALSEEGGNCVLNNAQGLRANENLFLESMRLMHRSMKPGKGLDHMTRVMIGTTAEALDRLEPSHANRIDLWDWVRHEVTLATTASVYGPENPFQSPIVEQSFWDFNSNIMSLLVGILPSLIARKGYVGREKLIVAFTNYFLTLSHKTGSALVQRRQEDMERYGLKLEDQARVECVNTIAMLGNTAPAAFWTLYHVLSDSNTLEQVRLEAEKLLTIKMQDGVALRTVDFNKIREIPLLISILRESLRYHSAGTTSRIVLEDVYLEGRYLLKKDTLLIMPMRLCHTNESTWGPTVGDFDAERFSSSDRTFNPGAFRGFGGGVHLCPGRFMAESEILAILVMFVLRYDARPIAGRWVPLKADEGNMSDVVAPPLEKTPIDVFARRGWEGGRWRFAV